MSCGNCRVVQRGTARGLRSESWHGVGVICQSRRKTYECRLACGSSLQIEQAVNKPGPYPPWVPHETICELLYHLLVHKTDQLVDNLLGLIAVPLHGANLVTHLDEHVIHLSRGVRCDATPLPYIRRVISPIRG